MLSCILVTMFFLHSALRIGTHAESSENQRYFINVDNCGGRTEAECADYLKQAIASYCSDVDDPRCNGYQIKDYDCAYETNPCTSQEQICQTITGGFSCGCSNGYANVAGQCVDVDECSNGTADCKNLKKCRNTVGGYRCCVDVNCNVLETRKK